MEIPKGDASKPEDILSSAILKLRIRSNPTISMLISRDEGMLEADANGHAPKSKLLEFLYEHSAKERSPIAKCPSWTTDDDNIVPQARVGRGSLGDVYRVLPPLFFLIEDVQRYE